jgi:hypothetical protein
VCLVRFSLTVTNLMHTAQLRFHLLPLTPIHVVITIEKLTEYGAGGQHLLWLMPYFILVFLDGWGVPRLWP